MRPRPSGTVTFLFTDVEGSTLLLGKLGPAAYAAKLEFHHAALRRAWEAHDGVEIDTQGDSFFVAFSTSGDAAGAARAAQALLQEHGIRVRMGIHTGEPLLTEDGYVGMDVHRAARIAAAGHGGQILLSHATRDLLVDERGDRRSRRAPPEGSDPLGAHLPAGARLVSAAPEPQQIEPAGNGAIRSSDAWSSSSRSRICSGASGS